MGISAQSLETLLADINGGRSAQALPELDQLLVQQPNHPGLLTLRAEALRLTGRLDAAVAAFRRAGESGAGPRNWLIAGLLLANGRSIDESLVCLRRALLETPDSEDVLDALITTLFNSNRHHEGVEFARGLTNYATSEAKRIRGLRKEQARETLGTSQYAAVVHRDNLVLIE